MRVKLRAAPIATLISLVCVHPTLADESSSKLKLVKELETTAARYPLFVDRYKHVVEYMILNKRLVAHPIEVIYCSLYRDPHKGLCKIVVTEYIKKLHDEYLANLAHLSGAYAYYNGGIAVMNKIGDNKFVPVIDANGYPVFEKDERVSESYSFGGDGQPVTTKEHSPFFSLIPNQRTHESNQSYLDGTLLGAPKLNVYGPGLHSDATGRPFTYRTDTGQKSFGVVKPNAYGLGVGMDQFGRAVRATPEW